MVESTEPRAEPTENAVIKLGDGAAYAFKITLEALQGLEYLRNQYNLENNTQLELNEFMADIIIDWSGYAAVKHRQEEAQDNMNIFSKRSKLPSRTKFPPETRP